jgi:hypothetical protein
MLQKFSWLGFYIFVAEAFIAQFKSHKQCMLYT